MNTFYFFTKFYFILPNFMDPILMNAFNFSNQKSNELKL